VVFFELQSFKYRGGELLSFLFAFSGSSLQCIKGVCGVFRVKEQSCIFEIWWTWFELTRKRLFNK